MKILLDDGFGNIIDPNNTGLFGAWAFDQASGTYIYPGFFNQYEFTGLAAGTYTFGAFDGYFEGAGTTTVTLDPSLVGSDGFITVIIGYWSE